MQFKNDIEAEDTRQIVDSEYINLDYFKNSTIMITGATGLIGSQLLLSVLLANELYNANIKVLACVRNLQKAEKMFSNVITDNLKFVVQDIIEPLKIEDNVDFIIHTANSTSSKDFVEYPVETITSIVLGTKNILDFAKDKKAKSVVYLSSMEVFGKTDFQAEKPLTESDYGYIDLAEVRSSYPEGKRLAENLCVAYAKEYDVPVKIARLVQTIGANVSYSDNRVFSQFARNIAENKDIILHTKGETIRSYCYVTDAITGILAIAEKGKNAFVYNIANPETVCSIKEMAEMLCEKYPASNLKFELENDENKYYLPKLKTVLDITRLSDLNWKPKVSLEEMYEKLIANFKQQNIK